MKLSNFKITNDFANDFSNNEMNDFSFGKKHGIDNMGIEGSSNYGSNAYNNEVSDILKDPSNGTILGVPPKYDVKKTSPRIGSRKNDDGTVSTHLMSYVSANDKYYAYPTLFQNSDSSWNEYSNKNFEAFEEAKKRNETYEFNNERQAKKFAKGNWKKEYFKQNK